jgi:signal transduction histidine kinase
MKEKASSPGETSQQRWWWRIWYMFFAATLVWLGACVWLMRPAPSWTEGWLGWWTGDRQGSHPSFSITTNPGAGNHPVYSEDNQVYATERGSGITLGRLPSDLERWTWAGWVKVMHSRDIDPQRIGMVEGRPWSTNFVVPWRFRSLTYDAQLGLRNGQPLLINSIHGYQHLPYTGLFHEFSGSQTPPFGEWFHLAFARDESSVSIWINGTNVVLIKTPLPNDASLAKLTLRADYFRAPGGSTLGWQAFNRILHDDLIIFNRVLKRDEVAALHQIGRGGWVAELDRRAQGKRMWEVGWPTALAALGILLIWKLAPKIGEEILAASHILLQPRYRPVRWIIAVGVLGSCIAAVAMSAMARTADERRFDEAMRRFQNDTELEWERIAGLCVRAKDWVAQQSDLTQVKWENWLTGNRCPHDYPGLVGIGYAEQVLPSQLEEHEAKWRVRHGFAYRVTPDVTVPRQPVLELEGKPLLPVVVYQSSDARRSAWYTNHSILGRDLLFQSIKDLRPWAAARRIEEVAARNEIQTSSLEELGPEHLYSPPLKGLQIYAPDTRRTKWHDASAALESTAWRGIAFAHVDFERLLLDRFGTAPCPIGFKISTGNPDGDRHDLITDSSTFLPGTAESSGGRLRRSVEMRFYYRRLFIDFWTTPAFEEASLRKWGWIFGFGGLGMTVLATCLVITQIRARDAQDRVLSALESANNELLRAYNERERISRDLHDGSIQNLYALGLHLQRVQALFGAQSERAKSEINKSLAMLDRSISDLRQFILSMERKELPRHSPLETLHDLVEQHRRTTDTEFEVRIHEDSRRLSAKAGAHLLRMAGEGISNALRHGKARWIELQLYPAEPTSGQRSGWVFEVRDNGQGFDAENAVGNGWGLKNLKARAAELEGECSVESEPHRGTTVRVTFTDPAPVNDSKPQQTRTA